MIPLNQGYGRSDDRDDRKDSIENGLFSNFFIMVHCWWICRVPSEHLPRIQLCQWCFCISVCVSLSACVCSRPSLSFLPSSSCLMMTFIPFVPSKRQKKKKPQSVRQPPSNSLELPYRVDASYRRSILNLPQARSPLRRIGTNKVVRCGALLVPVGQNESVDEQGLALLMKVVVVFRFFE